MTNTYHERFCYDKFEVYRPLYVGERLSLSELTGEGRPIAGNKQIGICRDDRWPVEFGASGPHKTET
jgi:hypothetical protein